MVVEDFETGRKREIKRNFLIVQLLFLVLEAEQKKEGAVVVLLGFKL